MLHRVQITKRFLAIFLAVIFLFTGTLLGFPGQARAYNDVCNDNNQGEIAEKTTVLASGVGGAALAIGAITTKASAWTVAGVWLAGGTAAVLAAPVAVGVAAGGLTYLAWETLHPNVVARGNRSGEDYSGDNLSGKDWHDYCLKGAIFHGADMRGIDLRGANLSGADLSNADLRGADLTGAKISQVNWDGANLTGVKGIENS